MLGKWRLYTRHYSLVDREIVFPHNLKTLFKGTQYQYCMIWELVKHVGYVDFERLLNDAKYYPSIEFLTKLKLYNLALVSNMINGTGNFEHRFGVSKELYPFMKKHNLIKEQLEILRLYKNPNIKILNHLLKHYRKYLLEELCKYTSIDRLLQYEKMKGKIIDLNMYVDYLENAKLLGYDLKNKKYLFPENLKESHDKLVIQVQKYRNQIFNKALLRRYKELSKNIYKSEKYIIIPPKTKKDFISEASQQGNCVYSNYFEKHAHGTSDIYFMRSIDNLDKSLVTVEVRNNKVVQSRIKGNQNPRKEELDFLQDWEKNILQKNIA